MTYRIQIERKNEAPVFWNAEIQNYMLQPRHATVFPSQDEAKAELRHASYTDIGTPRVIAVDAR